MDNSEEKFFEQLAKGAKPLDQNYDVELAKASAATTEKISMKKLTERESAEPEGQLTIDVYQTPDDIVVESAVAGVRPEDIDIEVSNDSVSIKGSRHREHEVQDQDYFYQECYWGKFSRSVILPQEVDPESASVTFKNGVLTVRMPKINRKKSRKLKVKFE